MQRGRLEAFSDGVIAIIITIMVLSMQTPQEWTFLALKPLFPVFLSYVLSFVYVWIYWLNHHHLLHTTQKITTPIIIANINLLFRLSIIPFSTARMWETKFARDPMITYAVVLQMTAISYYILQSTIISYNSQNQKIIDTLKHHNKKSAISVIAYTIAIVAALFNPIIPSIIFLIVAISRSIPDEYIEKHLHENDLK